MNYTVTAQIISGHKGAKKIARNIVARSLTEASELATRQLSDTDYYVVSVVSA